MRGRTVSVTVADLGWFLGFHGTPNPPLGWLCSKVDMYCDKIQTSWKPPPCLLASYTTIMLALAYLSNLFERILVEWQPSGTTEDLELLERAPKWAWSTRRWVWPEKFARASRAFFYIGTPLYAILDPPLGNEQNNTWPWHCTICYQ